MIDRRNRIQFTIFSGILLLAGGVLGAYGQDAKEFPGDFGL